MPMSSSFCSCVDSPFCEGQSMFCTDATHTPLNSRRIGGGGVRGSPELTCDCPHALSNPSSTESERNASSNLFFGIEQQCKWDKCETAAVRDGDSPCLVQATHSRGADGCNPVMGRLGHRAGQRLAAPYDS